MQRRGMINECLHVYGYLPESRIKLSNLTIALQVTTELYFNISLDIRKSGNKNDLNNYRGISLQNCITKLFSSALNKRLMMHYEDLFSKHINILNDIKKCASNISSQ
jgi:hypothetical protein